MVEPMNLDSVTFKESPNQSSRPKGVTPTHIVLHHTGPGTTDGIVSWLCNKDAKVSAHYVVGTDGKVVQCVNTTKNAWHAGKAIINGKIDVNSFSIGIEICNIGILEKTNDGFYYEVGRNVKKYTGKIDPQFGKITYPNGVILEGYYIPYPEKQVDAVISLCKGLVAKYPKITKENIVTHFEIGLPIGRKNDPFGLDVVMVKNAIFGVKI